MCEGTKDFIDAKISFTELCLLGNFVGLSSPPCKVSAVGEGGSILQIVYLDLCAIKIIEINWFSSVLILCQSIYSHRARELWAFRMYLDV